MSKRIPKAEIPGAEIPGAKGMVIARTVGRSRHVTIYPLNNGGGCRAIPLSEDFEISVADAVLESGKWERQTDWVRLEFGVFIAQVVKV